MKSLILAWLLAVNTANAGPIDKFKYAFSSNLMQICRINATTGRKFMNCWERLEFIKKDVEERCWACSPEELKMIMVHSLEYYKDIMVNEKFLKS